MESTRMKVFNVRVTEELMDLVDRAVRKSDMNQSEWVREALEAGARTELARTRRRVPEPRSRPGGGWVPVIGRCVHPLPARRRRIGEVYCSLCGTVVRKL